MYRYEQSGELHGLTRVRGFTQDDAHIFCTPDQLDLEFKKVIDLVLYVFGSLGFENFTAQVSLRDKENTDVKMHYFDGGNCIGRFPLATNEVYINKQTNEKIASTEWHNLVVRNKAAEICEKYLSKGDKIFVEGRIKSRQWQAEDGSTKYTTEIQVTEFTFLTTKKEVDGIKSATNPESKSTTFEAPNPAAPENDLPF